MRRTSCDVRLDEILIGTLRAFHKMLDTEIGHTDTVDATTNTMVGDTFGQEMCGCHPHLWDFFTVVIPEW